jgi:hypothetical protein
VEDRKCYLPSRCSSLISTPLSFSPMVYKEDQAIISDLVTPDNGTVQEKSVINTTVQGDARVQLEAVITATIACNVDNQDITRKVATSKIDLLYGIKPKYLHYNVWSAEESTDKSATLPLDCLADWTENAEPLPDVPATK